MNLKNSDTTKSSESGNVLFLILTVVFLFAALTYAATSSTRFGGGTDSDRETTRVSSADLIQQASYIENAITRMVTFKGCSVDLISFEHSPYDGTDVNYVNPSSPTDFTCHIFHPAGGEVSDRTVGGLPFDFSGNRYIQDVGTTVTAPAERAELYAMIEVGKGLCKELNVNFDIANPAGAPPVLDGFGEGDLFVGTFDGTDAMNSAVPDTFGKRSFCGSVAGVYRYIHVLVAR